MNLRIPGHLISCILLGLPLAAAERPVPKPAAAAAESAPNRFGDNRFPLVIRKEYLADKPGYWYTKPPLALSDPVQPLGSGDVELFAQKRLKDADLTAFIDGYVDRIEAVYAAQAPQSLLEWLNQHRDVRRSFWLALSYAYDDIPAACRIMDTIRAADPKIAAEFAHLAIACAVVHDSPSALHGSRYACIWGITAEQFSKPPEPQAVFAYFTDSANQKRFIFSPKSMSWSMMVHLVDLDSTPEEREWALATASTKVKSDLPALYPSVPYDDLKLKSRTQSRLGQLPYTLSNLQERGGVCGDQGHFTSRVAKAFGIPAMKCGGMGRYGGNGHAWAGFVVARGGRPVLDFTGRYQFDYYYTGDIFDPQTETETLDRYVALHYDGASQSFPKLERADALARAAKQCYDQHPDTSLAMVIAAIGQNAYSQEAWRVLMQHIADGHVPAKDAKKWGAQMLKDLAQHPDLTIDCLRLFFKSIPLEDQAERQRLWNAAYALYQKRPDLQIQLRIEQCGELIGLNDLEKAIAFGAETIVANAKEGTLILPLVSLLVEATNTYAASHPGFNKRAVHDYLMKADREFPKTRGGSPSESYADFKKLLGQL